jgi:hypothetical protein
MTDHSVSELVKQASEDFSDLVRKELRLAQSEMTAKGKRLTRGGASFGAAAVIAFVGFEVLVGTAVVALDLTLPLWAAALIIGAALLALAGLLALVGRRQTARAAPMRPEQAIVGVKADMEEIRERAVHHDNHPGKFARAGGNGSRPAR